MFVSVNPMSSIWYPGDLRVGKESPDLFLVIFFDKLGVLAANEKNFTIVGDAGEVGKVDIHLGIGDDRVNVQAPEALLVAVL